MLGWTVLLGVVGLMLGIFTLGTLYIILSNIKLTRYIFLSSQQDPRRDMFMLLCSPQENLEISSTPQ